MANLVHRVCIKWETYVKTDGGKGRGGVEGGWKGGRAEHMATQGRAIPRRLGGVGGGRAVTPTHTHRDARGGILIDGHPGSGCHMHASQHHR